MIHTRYRATSVIVGLMIAFTANAATAAKEKFVRVKPHVNLIGPLDLTAETLTVAIGLLVPAVQQNRDGCAGTVDVRVLDAGDPGGDPLAESTDNRLPANTTFVYDYDPNSPPRAAASSRVYVSIVLHTASGFRSPDCLLRGQVETRDESDGKICRSLPVRPEDFIRLR